jgi:general stress protein YciG
MTVEEAGRKGGETTARKHGREFYEEIGRKGGEARSARLSRGDKPAQEEGGDSNESSSESSSGRSRRGR